MTETTIDYTFETPEKAQAAELFIRQSVSGGITYLKGNVLTLRGPDDLVAVAADMAVQYGGKGSFSVSS